MAGDIYFPRWDSKAVKGGERGEAGRGKGTHSLIVISVSTSSSPQSGLFFATTVSSKDFRSGALAFLLGAFLRETRRPPSSCFAFHRSSAFSAASFRAAFWISTFCLTALKSIN